MNTKLAVIILACDQHADEITRLLDESQMGDWSILPAVQARRMGYLQNVPQHRTGNTAIFGVGERNATIKALRTISRATTRGDLCPDCSAFVWEVQQALLGHVTLDPVCDKVVDCQRALSLTYEGERYCFCSEECRHVFEAHPDTFVRRRALEYRIGRRELSANHGISASRIELDDSCSASTVEAAEK